MADPIITHGTDSNNKPILEADFVDGNKFTWPVTAVTVTPPTPTKPPAPTGLAAVATNDPTKGTLVTLSWTKYADPLGKALAIYRDAVLIQDNYDITWTAFEDHGHLQPTTQYMYDIHAKASDGTLSDAASVMVTTLATGTPIPPQPTTPSGPVPTNLQVKGMGNKTDQLIWVGVKGAVKYNVYSDDKLLGTTQNPNYTVQSSQFIDSRFYCVTAVDSMGMESLACPPCLAQGSANTYGGNPGEGAPTGTARGEWNSGAGRIIFEWHWTGGKTSYWGNQFRVYRDGQVIADNMSTFYYVDNNPGNGQHSYQVAVLAKGAEGPKSSTASATAPTAAPTGGGHLLIQQVDPNHNSCRIHWATYPGALDYRVSIQGTTNHYKYAGIGGLAVEWNGIDPNAPLPSFIVEALDKLGPWQPMDGTANASDPPISRANRPMPAGMVQHTNGQGDPSNVPNVIATSAPTPAQLKPKTLSGSPQFLDNFDTFKPLTQSASVDPVIWKHDPYVSGSRPNDIHNPYLKEYTNDKWRMRLYIANAQDTKLFSMGRHFMDTLSDGGVPGGGPEGDSTPPHNNNASTTFEPMANGQPIVFDFSGGKVIHVTMEVDSHFSPRRWCDMGIYPAGDSLTSPAIRKLNFQALEAPTQSGNILVWEIQAGLANLTETIGAGNGKVVSGGYHDAIDQSYPGDHQSGAARDQGNPTLNGSQANLDYRRTFDLYTDGKRVVIVEGGKKAKDATLPVPLPFTKAQAYFSHHVYHTVNEVSEAARRGTDPYYTNYKQGMDERHWNSMGCEILNSWPNIP